MKFYRPVDEKFPVLRHFAEWHERWRFFMDPMNGLWIPRTSEPGHKGQHRGVDFDCPRGTIISAMANGMVVKARFESALDQKDGAGLHILQIVEHKGFDAWWIKYSHLKTSYVQIGQKIQRGQPIGESGDTGDVDAAFLHVDLMDPRHQFHPLQWT